MTLKFNGVEWISKAKLELEQCIEYHESSANYPGSVITLFICQFNEDYISLRDNNTRVALRRNFEPSKKFPDA